MAWLMRSSLGQLSSALTNTTATSDHLDNDKRDDDILPRHHQDDLTSSRSHDANHYPRTSRVRTINGTAPSSSKVLALDGLRGLACLIVYNYHFLWPYIPHILLGYGARTPHSAAQTTSIFQLPILCLLHRGRPMVAIFFAISGYVVCRHILKLIHERRVEEAYNRLGSAVFRRAFRLYIPATLSMLCVAVLAQMGGYKSEFEVYKGGDSVYINGTVATYSGTVDGFRITGVPGSVVGTEGVSLYMSATTNVGAAIGVQGGKGVGKGSGFRVHPSYSLGVLNGDWKCEKCPSVKLGGMWEEHPIIHPNLFDAAGNFTRTWVEWANPFTFSAYHTRYDPHTYTMPMELRGSVILYVVLLATAKLAIGWRVGIGAALAVHALRIGRWEVATFLGGMCFSEIDLWKGIEIEGRSEEANGHAKKNSRDRNSDIPLSPLPSSLLQTSRQRKVCSPGTKRILRYIMLFISLYLLSYPDTHAEVTPGFRHLAWFTPKYYPTSLERWRFHHSLGALLFLPCALRTRFILAILESRPAQHFGRISFAFYLIHGPVLHSLGFWIMPRLFDAFGGRVKGEPNIQGLVFGWVLLGITSMLIADAWERRVDVWSIKVGKRVEAYMAVKG